MTHKLQLLFLPFQTPWSPLRYFFSVNFATWGTSHSEESCRICLCDVLIRLSQYLSRFRFSQGAVAGTLQRQGRVGWTFLCRLWAPSCGPTRNLVPELHPTKWWLTGIYICTWLYFGGFFVVELAKMNLKASLKSESRTEHELWTRSEDFFPECVKVTGVRKIHQSPRVADSTELGDKPQADAQWL